MWSSPLNFAELFFSSVPFVVPISGVLFVLPRPNARLLGHSQTPLGFCSHVTHPRMSRLTDSSTHHRPSQAVTVPFQPVTQFCLRTKVWTDMALEDLPCPGSLGTGLHPGTPAAVQRPELLCASSHGGPATELPGDWAHVPFPAVLSVCGLLSGTVGP